MAAPPAGRANLTRALLSAVLLATAVPIMLDHGQRATADPVVVDYVLPNRGPLGAVTVIGDSVMLGHGYYEPTLADQLVANGWGPVRLRGGVAISAGNEPVQNELKASWWIEQWRAQGWDAPVVLVNVGANDSGFCKTNINCAREAILHVVDAIGPGKRIWWPMITRLQRSPFIEEQNNWNAALAQIAAERDDFWTWDWPREFVSGGYSTSDGVHLTPSGYRRRSALMAERLTADLATSRRMGGEAALPAPSGPPSTFVPVDPVRVVDTRTGPPGRRGAASTMTIDLTPFLPDEVDPGDVTAAAVQVTAAEPSGDGFLAARRCDSPPGGSSVNYTAGASRGAMTISPVDAGTLCVYAHTETDVVVDLQGLFVAGDGGASFTPVAPTRLIDTRETIRSRDASFVTRVPTPPQADAVAVNLTAAAVSSVGNLRAYPCDTDQPTVSNVNYRPGAAIASAAFVPTGSTNELCVATSTPVDVIVDLTGEFRGDGTGLAFAAAAPTRTVDTRDASFGWSPVHGAGQTIDARVAPAGAEAVSGTLTMVRPVGRGFTTAYDCSERPATSSINAPAGVAIANSLTTGVSADGRLCLYSNQLSQTVFDTTGWWLPT